MTFEYSDYFTVGDLSSGPIHLRFTTNVGVTKSDVSAIYHFKDSNNKDVSGFMNSDMVIDAVTKLVDISCNLSENSILNKLKTSTSDISFTFKKTVDNSDLSTVVLRRTNLYNLPSSIQVNTTGLQSTSGNGRFGITTPNKTPSGDIMQQTSDLSWNRNVVLDLCGSFTGFRSSNAADWITDISWSSKANPSVDQAADWHNNIKLDMSNVVMVGAGKSHIELSIPAQHVFDISQLHIKANMKVPGGVAGDVADTSFVIDLSRNLANLPVLQTVLLYEYNNGTPTNKREIYNTPDIIYVKKDGGNFKMYRDKAHKIILTPLYFLVNRPYYFHYNTTNRLVFTGSPLPEIHHDNKQPNDLVEVIWKTAGKITTINTEPTAISNIPVIREISHNLDPTKKEHIKWVGKVGSDTSSVLSYQFQFSTLRPDTEMKFHSDATLTAMDLSAHHMKVAGKDEVNVKRLATRVGNFEAVDVSFVINVPADKDISLDHIFINSKIKGTSIPDVSSALLPPLVFPHENVYQIPDKYKITKVSNAWTGIITASKEDMKLLINDDYDAKFMSRDIVQIFVKYNGSSAPYFRYYTDEKMQHEVEYLEKERIYRFIYKGASRNHPFFVSDSDGGALATGFSIVNNPSQKTASSGLTQDQQYVDVLIENTYVASSMRGICTSHSAMEDNISVQTKSTNRTWFDVNQATNYVEISLNHILPSDVSASWFRQTLSDASYIQYSIDNGTTWKDVSYNKKDMIQSDKQTLAFSICGEVLTTHTLLLKQHFRLYDHEKTDKVRDISFVTDVTSHVMKQPVLKSMKVFDHKKLAYVDMKDVSYIINPRRLVLRPVATAQQRASHPTENGKTWESLFDLSAVARYEFDKDGNKMGPHNNLTTHYDIDASMAYTIIGDRQYINQKDTHKIVGHNIVDICGVIQHEGSNLKDLSFSLMLKRKGANYFIDACGATQHLKLDVSKVWDIPCDLSWVGAFKTGTTGTVDETEAITKKFTNKKISSIVSSATNPKKQIIKIDVSGGDFPTDASSDFIKAIKYSKFGPTLTQFNTDADQNQLQSYISDISLIQIKDNKFKRIEFQFDASAIGDGPSIWLNLILNGPGDNPYNMIYVLNDYVDAIEPDRDFNLHGVNITETAINKIADDNVIFKTFERDTANRQATTLPSTRIGRLSTIQDLSAYIHLKAGDKFDGTTHANNGSFDVSFIYYYLNQANLNKKGAKPGDAGVSAMPLRNTPVTNYANPGPDNLSRIETVLKWEDLSLGFPVGIKYIVKADITDDAHRTKKDLSAIILRNYFTFYQPLEMTKTNGISTFPGGLYDVSMNIYSNTPTIPTDVLLRTKYYAKKLSFMASGEVDIFFSPGISFDMIPKKLWTNKDSVQSIIKSIDISYGTTRNAIGIYKHKHAHANNDISCIATPYLTQFSDVVDVRGSYGVRFNFDASHNAAALTRFKPHLPPLDMCINIVYYTNLAQTETSMITWDVPRSQIDWLDPPKKATKYVARTELGNAQVTSGKDTSFSTVQDMSMTVVLDHKFHHFFPKRYAIDTSAMIIDVSLAWTTNITGDGTTRNTKFIDVTKELKNAPVDASYISFKVKWEDLSKGLPISKDPSSIQMRMRIHQKRDAGHATRLSTDVSLLTFDISSESIKMYEAPDQAKFNLSKNKLHSVLKSTSSTPLTGDFSMSTWLDTSVNLTFPKDAFGHIYDGTGSPRVARTPTDVKKLVQNVRYDFIHKGDKAISINDCSFFRTSNNDIIQVKLKGDDLSKGVMSAYDPSAMRFTLQTFRDRAATSTLSHTMYVDVSVSDISYYVAPTKIDKVFSQHATTGGAKTPNLNLTIPDISFDISLSFPNNLKFPDRDTSKWIQSIKFLWGSNGQDIKTLSDASYSISADLITINTRFLKTFLPQGQKPGANVDISVNVYLDRAKDASMNLAGSVPIKISSLPTSFTDISTNTKGTLRKGFSIFGGDPNNNMTTDISFRVKTDELFTEKNTSHHIPGNKIQFQWLGGSWIDIATSTVSHEGNVLKFAIPPRYFQSGNISLTKTKPVFDISLHFSESPGPTPGGPFRHATLLTQRPKVQDISHYEYPDDQHVGDVSCVVAKSLLTKHKISAWTSVTNQDISINVNISGGREFISGTKHGKAWTPSDFIKDMSLNWRPQFGAHRQISLKSEIPHMCFKDASTVQFKIGKHDLSAGFMGSTGRLDISMTVYQDISKTVVKETNTSTGGVYPNVQAKDISFYQPPTQIKPTGIKSSLITHNKNNPVYFTDCSLSLWQDTSMTIELDNAFYTDVSKNVVVDLSYQLNWAHKPAASALLNKSVKATIDICSNNTKLLTFKLDGSDLSAGVPHKRDETKAIGTSDFSLNLHIYRDLAKTKGSNVDHIISTAIKSKDISYYHAPYYDDIYTHNKWLMDVSSVIKGGARHGQQIAGKLITSQADSTVTLTICGDMTYGTFFPTDVSSDWIKDVSVNWRLVDGTNYRPSTAIYKPSIKIQAKPAGKLNQIVFDLCNDIIQNKIAQSAQFFATIYVDRSKTTTIDISSKLILGTQSDPYIEQPVKPTTISLVTDVCNTSQLPGLFKTPYDTSVNLMIADPTKRIMSVKLTLDNPILQDTNAVVVKYRWKPYDATNWYDLGITNNTPTIKNTSVNYDFSLDPAPILWAVKNTGRGHLNTSDPGSRGDIDILDFSMSFRYPDGNYIDVSTSVTTKSIDADHINTFKVPTNIKDTSFAYITPIADGIKTDTAITKKPFSRVKDVSVNLQLSRKGTGAVSNWNTPLLFADVSYHVKSVSWKWTPNDGKPTKTKTILSSDSANWKKYVAPKFVTQHGDISGIEVLIEYKDISAGATGSLTVSAEFFTDLSYSPAGYTRDVSYISKVIDQANIVQYTVPTALKSSDISSSLAIFPGTQFPDCSFSHLQDDDISVNLPFTFSSSYQDFYQQYKGSTVTVEDLIKDASYSWNDTKYVVPYTDLSFIASNKLQMRVKKDHFKEYPTKPMKFTVRFYKDIAKSNNYYDTKEGTIEIKNIQKYVPPSIVKLEAYKPQSTGLFTDCSISLLDPKYPAAIRNSFYWARLKVTFSNTEILNRYNYYFSESNDPSLSMPITYSFYNADSDMHEKQIGLSGEDLHSGDGLYQVKTLERYKLGISSEDIRMVDIASGSATAMDFSINIQPILMGLSNKDFVDATASQQDKTGIKLWFKPYKHRVNDASKGEQPPFSITNGKDIFDSDLSLIILFKDISYYDGRALINTFNDVTDTCKNHILVKSNTGTAWKGAAITSGKLLDINKDCSMQLHFKFHHGSRFSFYNKDTTPKPLDFSMVVKDICFGYTGNTWKSLKVDGGTKYYDTENKFIDPSLVQFVVPKFSGVSKVDYDVSVVVHFNRDLCGNNQFTVGTHDVSFLIPKTQVLSFDGPKSLSYEKGMDMKTPGDEFISRAAQLDSYYSRYRYLRTDKFALSMREDTSLNIIFETMTAGQPAFGTYNGNPIFTTNHNIFIDDVSFSWNNGIDGSKYPIWQKIPSGDISGTMKQTARGDMMTYIKIPRIPDVSKSEFPGAFGEFVLSLFARNKPFSGAPGQVSKGDCKPLTLKISHNNIISNPMVIKLDDTTIVGDKASKRLIGWNTTLSKYTDRIQESIGISFEKNFVSKNLGLSYEEVSGKKYIIRNKHGKGGELFSLLVGRGGAIADVGKAILYTKRIQTIVYAGRSTTSAFVSCGNTANQYSQLGNVIDTAGAVSTSDYHSNGYQPIYIFINGQLTTRTSTSTAISHTVNAISPFNYTLTDAGTNGNSDIVMGVTNLNLDMHSALRIGRVSDTGTAEAGTPTADELGRIYAIHLYDASMTPQDLSKACLEMAKYVESVTKPTLELTKNSNIDWKSTGKGMVGITPNTPVMFDISSDTSMNLNNFTTYGHSGSSPFVTIKAKRNNVDTSYTLYPKSYTSSQIAEIKASYPDAKTAKDLSFSLYNMLPDMSNNTKRFTMVLEKDSVVGDAFVGDISCIDISMYNFKTRENYVISEQLIKQFTAPKMTALTTTIKYSGHDYNDPAL